eukprot:COSAG01_NODE_6429_length_3670_cov_6.618594_1_plen_333_part_00
MHRRAPARPAVRMPYLPKMVPHSPCCRQPSIIVPWRRLLLLYALGAAGGDDGGRSSGSGREQQPTAAAADTALLRLLARSHAALRRHDFEAALDTYTNASSLLVSATAAHLAVPLSAMQAAIRSDLAVWKAYRDYGEHPPPASQRAVMAAYMDAAQKSEVLVDPVPEVTIGGEGEAPPGAAGLATARLVIMITRAAAGVRAAAFLRASVYAGAVRDLETMVSASRGIISAVAAAGAGSAGAETSDVSAKAPSGSCNTTCAASRRQRQQQQEQHVLDLPPAISVGEVAAAHAQLGLAYMTQGSLTGNVSLHEVRTPVPCLQGAPGVASLPAAY